MTLALVSLAALAAGLGVLLGWMLYRHVQLVESLSPLTLDRDRARADAVRLAASLELEITLHRQTDAALAAARKEIANAKIRKVVNAPDDERGPAIDELLADVSAARRASDDRRAPGHPAVPGPGPKAPAAGASRTRVDGR